MNRLFLFTITLLNFKIIKTQTVDVGVFITISSLAQVSSTTNHTTTTGRHIELNWFNASPVEGDWVNLYTTDPQNVSSKPVASAPVSANQKAGKLTTKIEFPRSVFDPQDLRRKCLGFWIAYVSNDVILSQNCLKTEPNWMWDNREMIGSMTLSQLMIPGTHDAGSYQPYLGLKSENLLTRYQICQEEDFWNQFVYGIRYVDLRMGYYPLEDQFWLNHAGYRVNPFLPALQQIKTFIERTKEILILDFHNFPVGFLKSDENETNTHEILLALVISQIGDYLIPKTSYGYDVTLNHLWKRKNDERRILIVYNDPFYNQSEYYWPGLKQVWADTLSVGDLKVFFQEWFKKPTRPKLWSAQAELTPSKMYVLFHMKSSLRELADKVNGNVTEWFRDIWWENANVVATDFFLGNDVIDVAIRSNQKRARLSSSISN